MHDTIKVLDHGYIRLVETWGHGDAGHNHIDYDAGTIDYECGIIEAARQSTQASFRGWDEDSKLLAYLHNNKHSTPFEFAGMVIEVQAPIFVFREWHRHRTQCLSPDTLIHFDMPRRARMGYHTVYKRTIHDLCAHWKRNEHGREQIHGMLLRNLQEEDGEFQHSRIVDVIRGETKDMATITTNSGKSITASYEHRFFTEDGWMTLADVLTSGVALCVEGTTRGKETVWSPEPDLSSERWKDAYGWEGIYQVSTHGRVRRIAPGRGATVGAIKTPTIGPQGYLVVNLTYQHRTKVETVHTLVLKTFVGPPDEGQEARHKDHNRLNCSLSNLEWGSSGENSGDMLEADRGQRLIPNYEYVQEVRMLKGVQSYDLSVEGPWHNFVANGFVVHNSYNEMSARYAPLPDLNYIPTVERCLMINGKNRQAGVIKGADVCGEADAAEFAAEVQAMYLAQEVFYQKWLKRGIPKELARIDLPVGRYSRMRASANLRNWLAFVTLRSDPAAQWEIRQFSDVVGKIISEQFPRTWELFSRSKS